MANFILKVSGVDYLPSRPLSGEELETAVNMLNDLFSDYAISMTIHSEDNETL